MEFYQLTLKITTTHQFKKSVPIPGCRCSREDNDSIEYLSSSDFAFEVIHGDFDILIVVTLLKRELIGRGVSPTYNIPLSAGRCATARLALWCLTACK
jgi:hypothetical protein